MSVSQATTWPAGAQTPALGRDGRGQGTRRAGSGAERVGDPRERGEALGVTERLAVGEHALARDDPHGAEVSGDGIDRLVLDVGGTGRPAAGRGANRSLEPVFSNIDPDRYTTPPMTV